jgi:superoxide reductase
MLFYRCSKCGNFVTFLGEKTAATPVCCGEAMTEVVANTTDAAQEKHVPVVAIDGDTVTVRVGSVDHPMLAEHFIQFIILETSQGYQKKDLHPGEAPSATFALVEGEKPLVAYEYCNLHGLWKAER